ncbi:hypothetical protein [Streptomyces lydicus]|uniref:hypothetical protein n=1 Tax=Streptomyces lydicus TaxID=47763 RepID=UPI0036F120FD
MTPYTSPATPTLALPPAFEAFYALHYPSYFDYARVHLTPAEATTCINTVFGTLISRWDTLVGSLNPTAEAWDHLSCQVRERTPYSPISRDRTLHYDVRILTGLGYAATVIAAITGRDASKIRYLSRTSATSPPSTRLQWSRTTAAARGQ